MDTRIPLESDDDLVCDNLLCLDDDMCAFLDVPDLAWKCEVTVSDQDIQNWRQEPDASEMAFVVSAAKQAEVQNWLKTGTITKILRNQVPHDQILRCRWVMTWKPIDPSEVKKGAPDHKAKARLVILGYPDPNIETLP